MLTGFIAAMLVIAGLAPTAYNTMAGFTMQHLRQEQNQLREENAKLDLEQAKLLSLDRLQQRLDVGEIQCKIAMKIDSLINTDRIISQCPARDVMTKRL